MYDKIYARIETMQGVWIFVLDNIKPSKNK